MIGLIAAVDPNWVIGLNGTLPWHYKADFKRFKARTKDSVCIMGRGTWESLPAPLAGRRMIVLTTDGHMKPSKHPYGSCEYAPGLSVALLSAGARGDRKDIWFLGGESVYRQAFQAGHLGCVDLTFVPEVEVTPGATVARFPHELLADWQVASETVNPDDPRLVHRIYERRKA